jgi:hypothetical protein
MTDIQEVKEFFLRTGAVITGRYRDRESNFDKIYSASHTLAGEYKMFLEGHYPSEDVYKKLFASIPFILNSENTAFEKQQGLVQRATDAKAVTRDSNDNADLDGQGGGGIASNAESTVEGTKYLDSVHFTTAVMPHQLPEVYAGIGALLGTETLLDTYTTDGIKILHIQKALSGDHSGLIRKEYKVGAYVDNTTIEINGSEQLTTIGYSGSLTVVTNAVWNAGTSSVDLTTKTLTITNGVITSIA